MKNKERKVKFLIGNGSPIIAKKQGRNEKCSCGSGKKVKNCHNEEKYFNSQPDKITMNQEQIEEKYQSELNRIEERARVRNG
jgi:hypothetical protein